MPLIQTIIDEIQENGICPSHGRSAARTSWIIDEVLKEYRETFNTNAKK
ncbi:hypothetical protein ABLA30_12950 [Xenorhabdus nematophila]|nr:hypothetical protein [Xenorhabdus nematophila]QNJ35194.1 hypothetical protein H8F46_10065 [Xenorhabdus nematophila]